MAQDAEGHFSFQIARKMYGRDISGHVALKSVCIPKSTAFQLFQYLDREIALVGANGDKKYALIRDKVMLLCGHHHRLTQKQLVKLVKSHVKAPALE